ncbi:MAG: leucine-rich repeat protein, partial [Clostridia bacterium]|nr:leucine-rich repeat protein [Clostridia bacterium]
MSKIFKNLISILLCSVLLLSTVAVGVSAADITYGDYGIFHYMINYSVDGGTLSIVGCDTSASGHIVVPDTIEGYPVSGIGGGAFMNCSGITEITIGESVQAIDSSPFAGCSNLQTINFNAVDCEGCLGDDAVPIGFGESMIGTGNYTGNNTVTTVNFGSRVSSISPFLLYGFSQLKQITIPESVTSIGEFAFLNCNSVETLTYNAVNAELENNWFCFAESAEDVGFGSKSLKTINIGENVSVLPIFEDLKYLETVNYNAVNASTDSILLYNCSCSSVNIGENVKYIPSLCYECTGIDEITIPEGVERIAMFAFNLCNVKTVNYNAVNAQIIIPDDIGVLDDVSKALYGCMIAFDSDETTMSSISSINIGTGVKVIPSGILGILPELTNISIPASVETIEGICFLFSQKLGAIDVDALNSSYKSVDGVLFTADGKTLVKYPEGKKSIKDYSIPEGTQTVSDYAFTGSELEVVRIPASVKHIGTGAFACGYTSLDSDYYGENGFDPAYATLRDVYYSGSGSQFNALYNPDDANEELSAAALHFLNDEPVGGTYGPLSYEISNGEVTITDCDETISGELVIPDTIEGYPVTSIGDVAFSYCSKLTETTIPDGVKSIGIGAFYGCTGLTSIVIPSSVITISANAFIGCTGLTNITIPDSVTNIGNWAFEGCTGLTSITIPNSVTSINVGTFWGCSGLTSITIPNSVTYIGSSAFSGCIGLTSVTVPS